MVVSRSPCDSMRCGSGRLMAAAAAAAVLAAAAAVLAAAAVADGC